MAETFRRVKTSLVALLCDTDHRVIALKGKWGTGKTYLWRVVETELFRGRNATEQPIYVSLFGAKTINDLKLRILQNAYLKDASTVRKLLKTVSGFAKQILLAMARALRPTVGVLDPGGITDVVFVVEKLGDSALAREFLDAWLLSIEVLPEYQQSV